MLEKQEQEKQNQTIENEEEAQEQAEEKAQKQADDEEILSEEQLEIAEYKAKIEALDAKIAEYAAKKVDDNKRELMRKWCYTDVQIERYIKFIEGQTVEEIEKSIAELAKDIPPAGDNFADPSPFNGIKQKPAPADLGEVGKTLFERIKHKIWGGGVFL